MNQLLVEIGTEEIPAGYIHPALAAFSSSLLKKLSDSRIEHAEAKTYGSPRRLTVIVDNVAVRQLSLITEVMGPPEKVGFDENKKATVAAKKFAEKNGVSLDAIKIKDTGKGRYLYLEKTESGLDAIEILKRALPEVILSVQFPKSMHWSDLKIQFARPIHWICAMLGEKVISFQVGNIKSSRYSFGHRFLSPGKVKLSNPEEYLGALSSVHVLADISQRKELLQSQMAEAVKTVSGNVLPDPELVDIVANLIEFPVAVVGRFDRKFLELPKEILITAMREHQKYFAVIDSKKEIMPYFIAINNTAAKDMALVAAGHERVLRARLEDARFFYQTDSKISLDDRLEKLKSVLFQAELGSVYDKTFRIEKLALKLCELLNLDDNLKMRISRAARLCKTDLVSHAVGEFPKLQGIMGRVYATLAGESAQVASAIEEHYRPVYSGGLLPETTEGSVLSIADKIDSICGFFSIGMAPTGTSDPNALRRQGIGIIQIALDKNFKFSLKELICASAVVFGQSGNDLCNSVLEFLKGRMANILETEGISKDAVSAILSVSADDIIDVWKRAHAMERLKSEPNFEILAVAFKRVVNIIKKADPAETSGAHVEISLFQHESELHLYNQFMTVNQKVSDLLKTGEIDQSFKEIASLRPSVDKFFDDVLVMDENPNFRKNRLALLSRISELFAKLADFSKIST